MTRTYGAIERTETGWLITAIEPHVAMRLKAIFPRIPKTGRPPFALDGGPQVDADLTWFMSRYPLAISERHRKMMAERKTLFDISQSELTRIMSPVWKPSAIVGFRDGERPYDYQAQAAEIARRTGRLLLMDDLGAGKTVSGIATFSVPEALPALVVPPTHLVQQWVEKIEEFTHLRVHVFRSTSPYELPPADVYICPYSKLGGWIDYADQAGFKTVTFDEIHELRNGVGTSKGRAAKAFADAAEIRLGLSATPIFNYGFEVYQVVQFLDGEALGSYADFITEWCKPGPGGKWIVSDPAALGTYLREAGLAMRRTLADVGRELQPVNVITHEIAYDAEVIEEDEALMRDLAIRVTTGSFTERGQAAREFDMRMRQATGIAKAPHVAAFVRMLLDAGQPVVLVGWHRDVYDLWQAKLAKYHPLLYTGTETSAQKDRTKRAFVSGESNLMILSLRSGAGLDGLQARCSTMVFGELDWSPQVHAQCIGRLRRPGQTRQVDAIYLTSDGGSDPAIISVLGLKASQSAGIVDPLSAPADQVTDTTRIQELAARYLASRGEAPKPPPPPPARFQGPQAAMSFSFSPPPERTTTP